MCTACCSRSRGVERALYRLRPCSIPICKRKEEDERTWRIISTLLRERERERKLGVGKFDLPESIPFIGLFRCTWNQLEQKFISVVQYSL